MQYITYFKYLLLHKWYVFWACLELGVPIWIAFFHDWDKFRWDMVKCYANFFYDKNGKDKRVWDKINGYYNPNETGNEEFDRLRERHIITNKHHWQYWKLGKQYIDMPDVYILEMLADWKGAALAQGVNGRKVQTWYQLHKNEIKLSYDTKHKVETYLLGFDL